MLFLEFKSLYKICLLGLLLYGNQKTKIEGNLLLCGVNDGILKM